MSRSGWQDVLKGFFQQSFDERLKTVQTRHFQTNTIFIELTEKTAKGSRKNNLTELAHIFRLALFDPKSQNHSNSRTLSRILRLRIG